MKERETKEKRPMTTRTHLKSERGWTDKLMRMFLPEPDLTRCNPNCPSGPPMLLFDLEKIEAIERTDEFRTQKEAASKRKTSAKKALETKTRKLREWLGSLEIEVPTCDQPKLVRLACEHYNEMQSWRRNSTGSPAAPNSEPKFIKRICVNYLRHCLTYYEEYLDEISGKVGFDEGYLEIRRKIFEKIAQSHPWLKDECRRQRESI